MARSGNSLGKGKLGVFSIVFFVVAASAPLVGMTGAVPVAMVLGNGAATPGAYLMAGITLLIFSIGYAAMSNHVTNTGAFFAFVGRGLGTSWRGIFLRFLGRLHINSVSNLRFLWSRDEHYVFQLRT